jgi:hypothetical protein
VGGFHLTQNLLNFLFNNLLPLGLIRRGINEHLQSAHSLVVTRLHFGPPITARAGMSTPLKKCIGSPEQKYISDVGKKAPELGAFSSGIRLGWDYPPACPSWHGVSGACSD